MFFGVISGGFTAENNPERATFSINPYSR